MFRWWKPVDLDKIVGEFASFKVKKRSYAKGGDEVSLYKDVRDEVEVEADTLLAMLSPFRAVLNQRAGKPFTVRDVDLRGRVLKMYPRNRPTPAPFLFSSEPRFEQEKA